MTTLTPLARARWIASRTAGLAFTVDPVPDPRLMLMTSAPNATASSIAFT